MATYLKYREAYTGRMVHNPVTKKFLELKKQGCFDIDKRKHNKNIKTRYDIRITDFRDPEHYLPYKYSEVPGFRNM